MSINRTRCNCGSMKIVEIALHHMCMK